MVMWWWWWWWSCLIIGVLMCCVWARSVVSNCVTLWTVAHQAPLSMGFSRQEYRSGFLRPAPGNLPGPGIESRSWIKVKMVFTISNCHCVNFLACNITVLSHRPTLPFVASFLCSFLRLSSSRKKRRGNQSNLRMSLHPIWGHGVYCELQKGQWVTWRIKTVCFPTKHAGSKTTSTEE